MTAVDEATDLDVDIDQPVPCTMGVNEACARPAIWEAFLACCKDRDTSCQWHKDAVSEYDDMILFLAGLGTTAHCPSCRAEWPGIEWRRL